MSSKSGGMSPVIIILIVFVIGVIIIGILIGTGIININNIGTTSTTTSTSGSDLESDSGNPVLDESDSGDPVLDESDSGDPVLYESDSGDPVLYESDSGDPVLDESDSSGPASGGPASGGPASGGPASGGPASGGPASGGSASGGSASGGSTSGGSASGGSTSGGSTSGGSTSGGSASGGSTSGSPTLGSPASGSPASGSPIPTPTLNRPPVPTIGNTGWVSAPLSSIPTPTPRSALYRYGAPVPNYDYPSNNIGNGYDLVTYPAGSPDPNPELCASRCNTNSQCIGFILSKSMNKCYLKQDFQNITFDSEATVYAEAGYELPEAPTARWYTHNDIIDEKPSNINSPVRYEAREIIGKNILNFTVPNYQVLGWDRSTGIFKIPEFVQPQVYLITATFFFKSKNANYIYMSIKNTSGERLYVCVDSNAITSDKLITYTKVEKLKPLDEISFRANNMGSIYEIYFNTKNDSYTNITITLLNNSDHYSIQDNTNENEADGRWFSPSTIQLPLNGTYAILGRQCCTGRTGDYLMNNRFDKAVIDENYFSWQAQFEIKLLNSERNEYSIRAHHNGKYCWWSNDAGFMNCDHPCKNLDYNTCTTFVDDAGKWIINNVGGDEFLIRNSNTKLYCSEAGRGLDAKNKTTERNFRCNSYWSAVPYEGLAFSDNFNNDANRINNFFIFKEFITRPDTTTNKYIGSASTYNILSTPDPSNNISLNTLVYSADLSLQPGTTSPWDTTNGIFTAPTTGIYLIIGSFLLKQSEFQWVDRLHVGMYVNNILVKYVVDYYNANKTGGEKLFNFTAVESIESGHKVYFKVMEVKAQIIIQFGTPLLSKSNITFTKLNNININFNITASTTATAIEEKSYNKSTIILKNYDINFIGTSITNVWNKIDGIFTVLTTGTYLISMFFVIPSIYAGKVQLKINNTTNTTRLCVVSGVNLTVGITCTFNRVQKLVANDKLSFVFIPNIQNDTDSIKLYFDRGLQTKLNITLLYGE